MKSKNTIWWIIGIILSIILITQSTELFSAFNINKLSYTNVKSLTGITVGGCWNEREVVSIQDMGKGIYKIAWLNGCNCQKWNTPTRIDATLYFWSDEIDYRSLKDYSNYVVKALKSNDLYKNYNFMTVYQRNKNNYKGCDQTKKDANHIVIGVTTLESERTAGVSGIGFVEMSFKYKRRNNILIHEISHAYGLEHVSDDMSSLYKNNYMLPFISGSKSIFLQWQKDIIISILNNKLQKCENSNIICYPDNNNKLKLFSSRQYPEPIPLDCPCIKTKPFRFYQQ